MALMNTEWVDQNPATAQTGTGLMAADIEPQPVQGQNANAQNANASTYNPYMVTVSPDQTVQGQLEQIINKGSPMMTMAETRAKQAMNARGLMNSSMAVQAGQQAVIDSAMPIAQQDASRHGNVADFNATSSNQAGQFNAGIQTDVSKFNAGNQTQTSQFNAAQATDVSKTNAANALQADATNQGAANDMAQFNTTQQNQLLFQKLDQQFKSMLANADATTRIDLQNLQGQTQQTLANIEADYKTLMQTSQSASDMFRQALSQIGTIVSDVNMDAESKAATINGYLGWLANGMNLVGSINGVDLTDLLDFGTVEVG